MQTESQRYAINWNEEQRKYYFSLPPKSIVQIDDDGNLLAIWESLLEIKREFQVINTYVFKQGISNAIRKGVRCKGYFWMYKSDFEKWKKGEKTEYPLPNFEIPKRYRRVYVYEPNNRLEIHPDDYKKYSIEENKNNLLFLGRFPDAVRASEKINVSVSNIREVLKGKKILHKGYYFSFTPLFEDDDLTADLQEQEEF